MKLKKKKKKIISPSRIPKHRNSLIDQNKKLKLKKLKKKNQKKLFHHVKDV